MLDNQLRIIPATELATKLTSTASVYSSVGYNTCLEIQRRGFNSQAEVLNSQLILI